MNETQNDWKNKAQYPQSELDYIERTFGSFDEYVALADDAQDVALLAEVRAEADSIGVFDLACREAEDLVRPIYKVWGC